jgi:hypothetical protein
MTYKSSKKNYELRKGHQIHNFDMALKISVTALISPLA